MSKRHKLTRTFTTMNATKILNALQTALFYVLAICDVIYILLFGDWEAEATAAKKRLEAKAIAQTTEPETAEPLTELQPQPETQPELETIPNPWDLPSEPSPELTSHPQPKTRHLMLCLPAAKPEPLPTKKTQTAKTKTAKTSTTTKTKTRTKKAA